MLKRIQLIKGIGLFHDANGGQNAFDKTTLIYAENGRGKTTLANILRSCSTGNATLINTRITLDGTNSPEVKILDENGAQISFSNGAWSQTIPTMQVFDTDFVEENVYSGSEVRADHRQGLLEFALGAQAVAMRHTESAATTKFKQASEIVTTTEKALAGYHNGISLAEFINLPLTPDADQQLEALEKKVAAAKSNASIQQRAVPSIILEPTLDLDALFGILGQTLQDIANDAEEKVKAHVAQHGGYAAEDWINRGLSLQIDSTCPFCGQGISGNDLIKAFRTYFNNAYSNLKQRVASLERGIETRTGDQIIDQFISSVTQNQTIVNGWSEQITLPQYKFDKVAATRKLTELRKILSLLASAKQQSPLDIIGNDQDKHTATTLWSEFIEIIRKCNKEIAETAKTIHAYKESLATEDIQLLVQQINRIKFSKVRHQQTVTDLINQLDVGKNQKLEAEKEKTTARNSLDTLMKQVLQSYQVSINLLLKKFGASFEIAKMDSNYLGGSARTEYGLRMRGKDVKLSGSNPSFKTALSEGDKRTLAFAFFVAAIQSNPSLSNLIVVIDDPMCSLDRNRRGHTRRLLKEIGEKSHQLIVLGHDLYFLRDLRDDLSPHTGASAVSLIKLIRSPSDYTTFSMLDIDRECEADYYRHHRTLAEFIAGTTPHDLRAVAKSIRPMLEGYLHRRFPRRIKRGALFGNIVADAKNSQHPDPLAHLHSATQELNEINAYAGQFHHDTNAAADSAQIVDTELKTYAERALTIVHKGAP